MEKGKITIVKATKIRVTEMTVYSDLVVKNKAKTRLGELGVKDFTIFESKPTTCKSCKSKEVVALEVLGASDEVLFWICNDCDHLHLKIDKEKTEECLEIGSQFWSNPNDWDMPEPDDYI